MPTFVQNFNSSMKGSKRMLLVLGVAAVVAVGAFWLNSSGRTGPVSEVRGPLQAQHTIQGKQAVSPEMERSIIKADTTRVDEAKSKGGSVLPTVRVNESTAMALPDEARKAQADADRLPRPRPPQLEIPQIGLPPLPVAPAPIRVAEREPAPEVTPAMYSHALSELGRIAYPPAKVEYFYKPTTTAGVDQKALQAQTASGSAPSSGSIGNIPLPLPGTILYAELVGEANSDQPGPVLARILQGDLAGATLIGSFNAGRDTLGLRFTTLSLGTSAAGDDVNKTVPITAVGVDSRTVGPGLATDVDHHFLVNVGTQAAAAFAQGFGQAIAQGGQTLTATSGVGYQVVNPVRNLTQQLEIAGGAAGGAAGQALVQTYGNRPTTISIAAGTPVGILFLPSGNGNQ